MANIQSAKKRSRQAVAKNSLKSSQRATMRTLIKGIEDAVDQNDPAKAKSLFLSTPVSYTHLTLPTKRIV